MELYAFAVLTFFSAFYSVFANFALKPSAFNSVFSRKTSTGECLLQVDEGPCRGQIERYYYNTITQKCEEFYYGGCQGNANNFKGYQECQKSCFRIPKIPQICRFPKEEGPCRALHTKYFFNMTTMQCESFYYGGCQGNVNRFSDITSCKEYCSPHKSVPVICLEPVDKGRCAASIPRYYYNTVTKECEEFLYSGCGGSSNNFVSRQSCTDVCAGRKKHQSPGRHRRRLRRNRNARNFTVLQA